MENEDYKVGAAYRQGALSASAQIAAGIAKAHESLWESMQIALRSNDLEAIHTINCKLMGLDTALEILNKTTTEMMRL